MATSPIRRSLRALALAILVVAAGAIPPIVAAPRPPAAPVSEAQPPAARPDLSESRVQDREPRPFRRQTGLELTSGAEKGPSAALVPVATVGRSATTRTEHNADGSFTTTLSVRPLHWRDERSGTWNDFDDRLRTLPAAEVSKGFGHGNRTGPFEARFATAGKTRAGGTVLSLEADGTTVGLSLPGARPARASLSSGSLRYESALPGVELRYRLDREQLKEDIVLTGPPAGDAPLSLVFQLDLEGLRAEAQDDGSIALLRTSDGRAVFVLPRPFMVDAAADRTLEARYSPDVAMTLGETKDGRTTLTIDPDQAWLNDPARVYPVTIDPTFHYGNGRTDTAAASNVTIDQANPTINYSGASTTTVGKTSGGQRQDTLVRFTDLDTIPRDATVTEAALVFDPVSGTEGLTAEIRRLTAGWDPATVTWATGPASASNKVVTTTLGPNGHVITSLVGEWTRGITANHGLKLNVTGSGPTSIVLPASGAGSPTLQVTYVKQLRLGLDDLYTYESRDHGGGTISSVNLVTGNLVLQHDSGSIGAKGYSVDLVHTFNGQDPYGQNKTVPDSWAVYGEGWSFSGDDRLFTTTAGSVVWKDGTGRTRIYAKHLDTGGLRTYRNPLQYGWTLTKDTTNPVADADEVWTLTADAGGERLYFDTGGKLTRREDRNGNTLAYAYDWAGRITTITDVASRQTTFTYGAAGSPSRLYRITDMAGRISQYGYDTYGNLKTVKHAVGTADETTTTFHYSLADQLTGVTNPEGHRSDIHYGQLHGWNETTTEGWAVATGSTGTVSVSTNQAYRGPSSLKANLGQSGVPLDDEIVKTYSAPKSWNSAPQELIAFVYLASGAPTVEATLIARNGCAEGEQSATGTLVAGGWSELHLESVDADPSCPLDELALRFRTPGGETYTSAIYVDHLYFRGLTVGLTDATPERMRVIELSHDPADRDVTVGRMDEDGILQPTTYRYTDIGQVDEITDAYANVTGHTYDSDWRLTSTTLPGTPTRTDTFTYYAGTMFRRTSTVDGETWRQGVDTATGDERYSLDAINEARRSANQPFQATVFLRDADGNNIERKLNWYGAGADLEQNPFPNETSTDEAESYTYTSAGLMETQTDPRGIVTKHQYDTGGNVTETIANHVLGGTDSDQNLTTLFEYDPLTTAGKAGLVTEETGPDGTLIAYTYDTHGRQLSQTTTGTGLGSGITTTTTTDDNGSVTSLTQGGVTSESTYDAERRLVKTVQDAGAGTLNLTTEYAYDPLGNQIAIKDARGTITRTFYDAEGRPGKAVANCTSSGTTVPVDWAGCTGLGTQDATWNLTTTHSYDERGNQTGFVASNGRETRTGYDSADRVIWRTENFVQGTPTSADQNLTAYSYYDEMGRETAVKAPTADRNTFTVSRTFHDEQGRVSKTVAACTSSGSTPPADPATCTGLGTQSADTNLTATFTYDGAGNKLSESTPDPSASPSGTHSVTTRYAYDDASRLCRVLENASADLQALADPCSTAVSGTIDSDVSTRYTHDEAGNLVSMVDARGNQQTYGYDALGRMTSRTDGLSNTLVWQYDQRGNRTGRINRVGSPSIAITWAYDGADRMTSRTADGVTVSFTHDASGNQLTAQGPDGTITSTYDRHGRVLTVDGDDGADTTYSFGHTAAARTDASGSYTFTLDQLGRETSVVTPLSATPFGFVYRADGQRSSKDDPNGNTTVLEYDDAGRLLTKVTTASGGSPTRASYTYTYNRAGMRLSEASTITNDPANGTASFAYDELGRLSSYGSPLGTSTNQMYSWQAVTNRESVTTGVGAPVTTAYDGANRVASSGFDYDLDGRLTERPGQFLEWDDLGRLVAVRDGSTNALVRAYTYDAADRLRTATSSDGAIRFRYVGLTTQVAQVVDDATNIGMQTVVNSWAGERLADSASAVTRYHGTNGHNDVTWTAGASGAVTATVRFDAWGNVAATSGATLPAWRFQGSWFDVQTSLYWVVTRWYAPAEGTFVSEDTVLGRPEAPDSRHLYGYGWGQPVTHLDPTGEFCIPVGWFALSCIPDALVIIGAAAVAAAGVVSTAVATYHYLQAYPVTLSWSSSTTAMEAGREFERDEVTRLRQRWPGWYIRAPKYFSTPFGARILDACAYYSAYHYVVSSNRPIQCWEIKSSSSATLDYLNNRYNQLTKDRWLTRTYGFPISLLWTTCTHRYSRYC